MKRASDEQVALITRNAPWTTDRDEQARHRESVKCVLAELLALRKVAEAATSMLQMAYANGEERAKWERLMGALVEAGY